MKGNAMPSSFGPVFIIDRAVSPTPVFVRDRSSRIADLAQGLLATQTHERVLGSMVLSVTVTLANGVVLSCPPTWVEPAQDFAALLALKPL